MKTMTIFGTRPEIIRLSLILKILDKHCRNITVHTGQNYEESLSDVFIKDLEVRTPDIHFGIRSKSFGDQVGQILAKTDEILRIEKPEKILILGDTNSALSSIIAARMGIPVFHMEAGNRCYDDRVPEEVNRRIIDHSSEILMPYTQRSKENLVNEGIQRERILVTGNPIREVLEEFMPKIEQSDALEKFGVKPEEYFLATIHRAENVDKEQRLKGIFEGISRVAEKFEKPIFISIHPRTAEKLEQFGLNPETKYIRLLEPLGFFDFVKMEENARGVLTDSGTVQEECSIFKVPNVTLRDVTERPETVECGSNIISGGKPEAIVRAVELALFQTPGWEPPAEYQVKNVSQTIANIFLGYSSFRKHIS